ncbi:hypothetical protein [Xanthocytophaga flava]|uniref:hypothetical protein n=1 Tax=Xanthocytophaga flava TaxID=3048013 RepID=UPI0028D3D65A|nr:hypothetical protein [Xanthocytophaga flavus]
MQIEYSKQIQVCILALGKLREANLKAIIALGSPQNRKAVQIGSCTTISNPNGLSLSFSTPLHPTFD